MSYNKICEADKFGELSFFDKLGEFGSFNACIKTCV